MKADKDRSKVAYKQTNRRKLQLKDWIGLGASENVRSQYTLKHTLV